jgi:two-component system, NtrC family, nitrogen regulation response regulator GlnG
MLSMGVQTEPHAENSHLPHRRNVLIVEDERISRRALAELMSASGYDTETTGSAEEALDALEAGSHPDIALVDLDLPGMNGLDFISRLATLDPHVFPVLITASNGDNLSYTLSQRGVAYLRKPLDFDRLLSIIRDKSAN